MEQVIKTTFCNLRKQGKFRYQWAKLKNSSNIQGERERDVIRNHFSQSIFRQKGRTGNGRRDGQQSAKEAGKIGLTSERGSPRLFRREVARYLLLSVARTQGSPMAPQSAFVLPSHHRDRAVLGLTKRSFPGCENSAGKLRQDW